MTGEAMEALQMQAMLTNMGVVPGTMMPNVLGGSGGMPVLPGAPPQVDPAMASLYMQQMFQYVQHSLASQSIGAPNVPGVPPVPFPGGVPPYAQPPNVDPTISVSVEGMKFQYQLTQDDLLKVFSRYGSVKDIQVHEAGASATISFSQAQDAQAAMNDLNGKVLNGLEGTLRIFWLCGGPSSPAPFVPTPYPSTAFPGMPPTVPQHQFALGGANAIQPAVSGGGTPTTGGADKSPYFKGIRKYTCRFLIGIDNDKEFQVARRIIGAKGANMKRIVKQTEAKLRLRGVGSGYFEGAGQKESNEPLQLCISCTSTDGYKMAVGQVEDLLKRVYDEYKQYCRDNGAAVPDLDIQLSENQLVYSRFASSPEKGATSEPQEVGSPKRSGSGRRSRRSRGKRDGRAPTNGEAERGEPGPNAPSVEDIEGLIDDRNEARRANNFAEADRVREMLHKRGVALMDEPGGRGRGTEVTTWRYWRD